MGLVIAIIIIALIIGGIGLVMEALWWLLVIAAVLFVAGLVMGVMRRSAAAGNRAGRDAP